MGFNTQLTDMAVVDAQPNPAKQRTEFRYRLPAGAEQGTIQVTDLNGRMVAQFDVDENIGSIEWDTERLPEGVYLYSLATGNATLITKRLIIAR